MGEKGSGRSSSRTEHDRDGSFEVQNAYAEVRKCSILHSGKWHRGMIHRISMHRADMLMKKPLECGDRVELVMHFAAYDQPVRARGIIVRNREKHPHFEVGVEFIKIRTDDAKKFDKDRYLDNLLKRRDSELI